MASDYVFKHANPVKGPRQHCEHYPHLFDLSPLSWIATQDGSEFIQRCAGDVALVICVPPESGYVETLLGFSNSNDAMIFKLTWGGQ